MFNPAHYGTRKVQVHGEDVSYHLTAHDTKVASGIMRYHDVRIIGNFRETAQVITEFYQAYFTKPISVTYRWNIQHGNSHRGGAKDTSIPVFVNICAPDADHVPAQLLKLSFSVLSDLLDRTIDCHIQSPNTTMRKSLDHGLSSPFRILTNLRAAVPTFDQSPFLVPVVRPYPRSSSISSVQNWISGYRLTRLAFESPAVQQMQSDYTGLISP